MKGRANYLCRQKLYALRDNPLLRGLEEVEQFHRIANWERETETGDRAELVTLQEHSPLWHKMDARSEVCLGQSCPSYEQCFITTMRRKAIESDIIIVNHHLFFADLAIKQQADGARDVGILPDAAAVIFDEAHELEDVASQYFGVALSNSRFEELARDVEALLKAKGVYTVSILSACETIRQRARLFFSALPMPNGLHGNPLGRMEFLDREEFLESSGDVYMGALNGLEKLSGELDRLREVEEAGGLRKRAQDIQSHLKFLLESEDQNTVFWIERRAIGNLRNAARQARSFETPQAYSTHLQATPIDVSGVLADTLYMSYPSVVLTSATLAVAEKSAIVAGETVPGFAHLKRRLGIPVPKELIVPSHYDYAKQALLYLPNAMPEPRHPEFVRQAQEKIRRVLEITKGRAFCLFTSYAQMRDLHDRLLQELPYPLLLQGSAPRHVLLEEFRSTPGAVLFGTSSFWQGIDVQGEQLSCVIVDKLPFAVPTDPILKARTDAIAAAGGNAFADLQVPQAVIALKQGFGRLIRSLNDRGVLMLLDPRIRTTRYGATFLESLPPYRRTDDITEVERFFEESSFS
jgi:ATP-dependent DNA helicase DinG